MFRWITLPLLLAGGMPILAQQPQADRPIVPGFERFHGDGKKDPVVGGKLLLAELNCVSCHKPESDAATTARKQAPVLENIGARVRRGHLRKFLADPQALKPGSTMPNVFVGMNEKEKAETVEALVHFLGTTGTLKQEQLDKKLLAQGRDLYHKVGCVACHGTRNDQGEAETLLDTSVPLGDLGSKYSIGSLRSFLENPHTARPAGRMPNILTPQEANPVAHYLMQSLTVDPVATNVSYAYYEGEWSQVPDFDKLKPKATGTTSAFDVSIAKRNNNFAIRFEGYLRIDQPAEYTFHLLSDDGSKLWIDDKLVIDNDGVRPPISKSGKAKLEVGPHKLVIGFIQAAGGAELSLQLEGGKGKDNNPRQNAAPLIYLTKESKPQPQSAEKKDEEYFALDPDLIVKGAKHFGALGCADCHSMTYEKKAIPTSLLAPTLEKTKGTGGCLEKAPRKGIPFYSLNDAQRSALAAVLAAPKPADKPDPKAVVAHTMKTFNCYACHERDKLGGPEEGLNKHFTTTQPEMGDEGRIPPPLDGVGAKLNQAYFKTLFDKGAHDRTYMNTRMPRFGDSSVGHLAGLWDKLDPIEPVAKIDFSEPPGRIRAQARTLLGNQNLSCVKCHTFNGNKAEGIQAMDLVTMTSRLKRDWFHRYLVNPIAFRPGTRMPAAWPNGQSFFPELLGGKMESQIEGIWLYLLDGTKAQTPPGVLKASIPLVAEKEAVIYRNFIQGAGPRAIGVGYPEKINLAFDANDLRIAMIWQGSFIDAKRHWTDRGTGFEPPAGDNILSLAEGISFAALPGPTDAWPALKARDATGYQFRGYRLSRDQRPTFLYTAAGIQVEDTPGAGSQNGALKRTFILTTEKAIDNLYYRAAVGNKIVETGKGEFKLDSGAKIKIEGLTAKLREVGGKQEVLVPITFTNGQAKFSQEYIW